MQNLNPGLLKEAVIKPVLTALNAYNESAVNLLLGTCAVESDMGTFTKQFNGGKALGVYQMEPTTATDILRVYEKTHIYRYHVIEYLCIKTLSLSTNLQDNLMFQTALARLQYLRFSESLPKPDDIEGLAKYWKKYYNTEKGKGRIEDFIEKYRVYVGNANVK